MTRNTSHLGDDGSTGLLGEGRLRKYHPRIETLGTIDEASAALGLARSLTKSKDIVGILKHIQRDLYAIMAEVAATPENIAKFQTLDKSHLDWLESQVKQIASRIAIPTEFILPGENTTAASFSMARAIVRRSERRLVELVDQGEIDNTLIVPYLNRLSLLCFYLELEETQKNGQRASLVKDK